MSYAVGRATQILLIDTAILIALLLGYRHVLTGKTLLLWTHSEIKLTFVEMLLIPYKCNAMQAGGRRVGRPRDSYKLDKHLHWHSSG
jgi:hypothetical protein